MLSHIGSVPRVHIWFFFFLFLSSANESCPMLAWRGKTLTRTPPAQTRRKAPVWPSAKRSCFSFSNCSLMCQKKEKKKKRKKKNRFMLYRGSDALVFFCFFLECRSGWSRSLRNWNGECWNSWKGTKTRAGRKEKEDPGEKKTWKGHKKWVCWVSCGCVSWLKNQNVTSSKADATSQPFAAGWQQTVDSVLWIAEFIFLPRHVLACCLHQVLEK